MKKKFSGDAKFVEFFSIIFAKMILQNFVTIFCEILQNFGK
jgi:hypothetical protein